MTDPQDAERRSDQPQAAQLPRYGELAPAAGAQQTQPAAAPGEAVSPQGTGAFTQPFAGLTPEANPSPDVYSAPEFLSPESQWSDQRSADDEPREVTMGSRVASIVLALLIGIVYGCIGTVAHGWQPLLFGVPVPAGLLLAVVGVTLLFLGLRIVLDDRLPVAAAALGMLISIGIFTLPSTGGSVLIPQGVAGLIWTIAPSFIAVLVLAWPKLPQRTGSGNGRHSVGGTHPVVAAAEIPPADRA